MFHRHPFLEGEGGAGGGGGTQSAPTLTLQYNGAEITVPRPAGLFSQAEVNERYVPKATHDATMATMRTQLDKKKDARSADDFIGDETFRATAIERWGLNPTATQKQFNEQLERTKKEIVDTQVVPLKTKLDGAGQTIGKLRQKDLYGQIVQAAAGAKINQDLLKATTKGGTPMVVSMLRDAFDYSEEHDAFFAKGANGYAYSQTGDAPYMTVSEFIAGWAAGDGKSFIRSERQGGADAEVDGGQGGGGDKVPGQVGKELRLTTDQIRDVPFFKRMEAMAREKGLTIVPI